MEKTSKQLKRANEAPSNKSRGKEEAKLAERRTCQRTSQAKAPIKVRSHLEHKGRKFQELSKLIDRAKNI